MTIRSKQGALNPGQTHFSDSPQPRVKNITIFLGIYSTRQYWGLFYREPYQRLASDFMWSDHQRLEDGTLALHKEIAKRLEENPQLIEVAKANLERWTLRGGDLPVWRAWREILNGTLPQVLTVLLSEDEDCKRLRQSSPFCGILSPRERGDIYESSTVGAYYKSVVQHRQ